ncbi:MAG TPA: tetratricopeptide repeat protein [Pyrinomonadaceae bacterium]|nr:tetratricopeptide repeat protein [Pyrinomonadaceae bacterium]
MKATLLAALMFLSLGAPAALAQDGAWESGIKAGDAAMAGRRYAEAETAYRGAVKAAEKFKSKDPRSAAALIKLAESLSRQAKQAESEETAARALEALDRAVKGSKPKDSEEEFYSTETQVSVLEKAGEVFSAGEKYAEAEPLFKRAVALREEAARVKEKPKSNEDFMKFLAQATTRAQAKLAESYGRLAILYIKQRRHAEAEPLYLKAIAALEAEFGADAPPVADAVSRLATLYAIQDEFDKAEPLYARAVRAYEASGWLDKPETAAAMENYSLLLRKTGREAEAAAMFERAKAVRAKLPPK